MDIRCSDIEGEYISPELFIEYDNFSKRDRLLSYANSLTTYQLKWIVVCCCMDIVKCNENCNWQRLDCMLDMLKKHFALDIYSSPLNL